MHRLMAFLAEVKAKAATKASVAASDAEEDAPTASRAAPNANPFLAALKQRVGADEEPEEDPALDAHVSSKLTRPKPIVHYLSKILL